MIVNENCAQNKYESSGLDGESVQSMKSEFKKNGKEKSPSLQKCMLFRKQEYILPQVRTLSSASKNAFFRK